MNREKTPHLYCDIKKICSIILVVFLLTACGSCTTNGTITTGGIPTNAVVTPKDFDVKRDLDNAWATLTDVNQFVPLSDPDWKAIIPYGLVTTDNLGEAQLCPHSSINTYNECNPTEACHIYVFWDSTLKYSSCSESSTSVLCSYDGTQAFRNCDFSIQTLSADVEGLGTWFSVTYLRETQITLVIVAEGQVKVTPVKVLNFMTNKLPTLMPARGEVMPPLMDFQITERQMGEPHTSTIGLMPGQLQVYYTAPDAILQEMGLGDLPIEWQGIEGLNILRERLHLTEPNLEPWLQSIWQVAPPDIKLPPLEPLLPNNPGLIITGYDAIANTRFADALAYSVEWAALVKEFLRDDVPVVFNGSSQFLGQFNLVRDMRNLGYEQTKAIELFKETGYDRLSLMLVVTPDDALQSIAGNVQSSLIEYGLQVEIVVVPEVDLNSKVQSLLEQGAQVLVIRQK